MDCCENRSIRSINYERVCINCGVIHDYDYVHPFKRIYHFIGNLFIRGRNTCVIDVFTLDKLTTTQYYFLINH